MKTEELSVVRSGPFWDVVHTSAEAGQPGDVVTWTKTRVLTKKRTKGEADAFLRGYLETMVTLDAALLFQAADEIENEFESFDQMEYGIDRRGENDEELGLLPSCESPCCTAGWLYWLSNCGDHKVGLSFDNIDSGEDIIHNGAREAAGLSRRESWYLFEASWPSHWLDTAKSGEGPLLIGDANFANFTFRPSAVEAVMILRHLATHGFGHEVPDPTA